MCVFLKTLPSTAYCSVFKHLLFYPNIFHIGFESSELVVLLLLLIQVAWSLMFLCFTYENGLGVGGKK